jgi:hypothetical protein
MSGDPEQEYLADGLAQEAEAHAQLVGRLKAFSVFPSFLVRPASYR